MHRSAFISVLFISIFFGLKKMHAQLYKTSGAEVGFFSSAPLEDIEAVSKRGISVINLATGEISFQVDIRDFEFRKSKMQEHFNENFMESDRYPKATFKGKMTSFDPSEDGVQTVKLTGVLDVHGRKDEREVTAKILAKDDKLALLSQFDVACKDHGIKIPQILWQNIAEVVRVTVDANYTRIK